MKTINFIMKKFDTKKALKLDFTEFLEILEDFYDIELFEYRKNEMTISWEDLKYS